MVEFEITDVAIGRVVEDLVSRSWSTCVSQESAEVRSQALRVWQACFDQPGPRSTWATSNPLEGYFPFGSERAVGADKPDPKEFFHVYDPGILPAPLCEVTMPLFVGAVHLSRRLLQALDDYIPANRSIDIPDIGQHLLRVVHYPAGHGNTLAAPHTDITLFSLSLSTNAPGLEFIDSSGGRQSVDFGADMIAIHAGDMLEIATDGAIRSARHRVMTAKRTRTSIIFFANPPNATRLTGEISAGDALQARLREMGINAG